MEEHYEACSVQEGYRHDRYKFIPFCYQIFLHYADLLYKLVVACICVRTMTGPHSECPNDIPARIV
jgi:hypothetical protein